MKYEKLWQNVIKRRFSEETQDRLYLKVWLTYSMTLIALLFRIYSFLLTLVFALLWLSDHAIVSVSNAFAPSSKGDVSFHRTVYDYSRAN